MHENAPLFLLDARVEMVVPSFATLLAYAARQVRGDQTPFLGTVLRDQGNHQRVLLGTPGTGEKNKTKGTSKAK
jgi:hypothetical protein